MLTGTTGTYGATSRRTDATGRRPAATAPVPSHEDVVDAIYRPVMDPAAWTDCLAKLARRLESDGAYLAFWDNARRALTVSHLDHLPSIAERRALARYEDAACTDPRLDAILRFSGRAMTSNMLMPEAEFRKTSVYRNHLCEANIEHSMAVAVPSPQGAAVFCLTRRDAVSDFGTDDCEDLEQFVPHFRRALALGHGATQGNIERRIGWDLLDRSGSGLIVVDGQCRILRQNLAAERLCQDCDEIQLQNGRFGLTRRADQDRLRKHLAAISEDPVHMNGAAMAIPREAMERPLTIVFLPVEPMPVDRFAPVTTPPRAVLMLSDPSAVPAPRAQTMHALFGLTQTEARLVDALLAEPNLGDAAARLTMSKNTARQHLKSIFQKTRSNSQSQLLRLALSVPAMAPAPRLSE